MKEIEPPIGNPIDSHNPIPKAKGNIDLWWGLVIGVILLIFLLSTFIPDPFFRAFDFIKDGIGISLFVTVISFILVLVVGLIGGLGRIAKNPIISGIATIYVEVIRGIPLLVQLMFWYFAFPSVIQNIGKVLGLSVLENYIADPVVMATVGLTFCYGAYMSEVYRAGIQSIPKGQMEAARSLGMTYFQAMRYVIIPQALRVILPPVGNEFISLLKDSSLVSVVAVGDITLRGRQFMALSFKPVETFIMVALLYLVLTLFSARMVTWIERITKVER